MKIFSLEKSGQFSLRISREMPLFVKHQRFILKGDEYTVDLKLILNDNVKEILLVAIKIKFF